MNTIPQVLDPFQRTVRTGLQVVTGFVTFAPIAPLVVQAIHADDTSTMGVWLIAAAAWVTTTAAIIARVMAIPQVNLLLQRIGLAGHSGEIIGSADTFTTFLPVQQAPTTVDPLR